MTDSEIKIGDVVRLRSGGPAMTVTRRITQAGQDLCICTWFLERSNKNETGTFPGEALIKSARTP